MLILRACVFLVLVALLGFAADGLVTDNGVSLLQWQGWVIETSAIIALTSALLLLLIGFYLGVMIEWFVALPSAIKKKMTHHQDKAALEHVKDTLRAMALLEPDCEKQIKALEKRSEVAEIGGLLALLENKVPQAKEGLVAQLAALNVAIEIDEWAKAEVFTLELLAEYPQALFLQEVLLESLLMQQKFAEVATTQKGALKAHCLLADILVNGTAEDKTFKTILKECPNLTEAVLAYSASLETVKEQEKVLYGFLKTTPHLDVFDAWQTLVKPEQLVKKVQSLTKNMLTDTNKDLAALGHYLQAVAAHTAGDLKAAKTLAQESLRAQESLEGYVLLAKCDPASMDDALDNAVTADPLPQAGEMEQLAWEVFAEQYAA